MTATNTSSVCWTTSVHSSLPVLKSKFARSANRRFHHRQPCEGSQRQPDLPPMRVFRIEPARRRRLGRAALSLRREKVRMRPHVHRLDGNAVRPHTQTQALGHGHQSAGLLTSFDRQVAPIWRSWRVQSHGISGAHSDSASACRSELEAAGRRDRDNLTNQNAKKRHIFS